MVVVMPYGERSMQTAMKQERCAGYRDGQNFEEIIHVFRQIVEASNHHHGRGLDSLHGDVKPLNLVRVRGRWKLIGLDATARIAYNNTGFKCSSASAPPETVEIF